MPQRSLDIDQIRKDFPILQLSVHQHPLVYLDNAATTQKPQAVIDAMSHYYSAVNANVYRGVHWLSEQATIAYEQARNKVQQFIHAKQASEIIFVRGTTEAINLVAQSYVKPLVQAGDEILISIMEHHSNIVPWQIVCEHTGARLRVIPCNDAGELEITNSEDYFTEKTKFFALVHLSNALGTINPVKHLIKLAHGRNIPVLLDGAQAIAHFPIDVQDLDCDFYVFSGHKMYGPTGIGVLYGKQSLLATMPPYQGGGEMIRQVSFQKTTYKEPPYRFEAGTPAIAEAIGLATTIDYLTHLDLGAIANYEHKLLLFAQERLQQIPGLKLMGTAQEKAGVIAFTLGNIHAHDIGTILDRQGIAIRVGHHCTMPLMDRFGVAATARASLAFYNTLSEIDSLANSLWKVQEIFN